MDFMNAVPCRSLASLIAAVGLTAAWPVSAQLKAGPGEWPGWRGADRNGISMERGLLKEWPAGGPKLAWKATGLGKGFSTPSLAAGRIYLLGTDASGDECLLALAADGSKILWSTPFGKSTGGFPAPRSTPTFDGGKLYVISSDGSSFARTRRTARSCGRRISRPTSAANRAAGPTRNRRWSRTRGWSSPPAARRRRWSP
jgi:outer membrane protein assembly factor BamB